MYVLFEGMCCGCPKGQVYNDDLTKCIDESECTCIDTDTGISYEVSKFFKCVLNNNIFYMVKPQHYGTGQTLLQNVTQE